MSNVVINVCPNHVGITIEASGTALLPDLTPAQARQLALDLVSAAEMTERLHKHHQVDARLQDAIQHLRNVHLDVITHATDQELRRLRAVTEEVLRWTEDEQAKRDQQRNATFR